MISFKLFKFYPTKIIKGRPNLGDVKVGHGVEKVENRSRWYFKEVISFIILKIFSKHSYKKKYRKLCLN